LKSTLVSRNNWRRLESSILCMSSAFRSQEPGVGVLPTAFCLLPTAFCPLFYPDPLHRSAAYRLSQWALA